MTVLEFIQGKGHHWGPGITTHLELAELGDERCKDLHDACLALEKSGHIYRHFEDEKTVVWMPVGGID